MNKRTGVDTSVNLDETTNETQDLRPPENPNNRRRSRISQMHIDTRRHSKLSTTSVSSIGENLKNNNPVLKKKNNSMPTIILLKLTGSIFQAILTVFACIVYVMSTYIGDEQTMFFNSLELAIAILFTIDYILGFITAIDKKKFMLKPLNIIDIVIILPVYITLLSPSSHSSLTFTRFIRVVRVIRILRLYRLFALSKAEDQPQGGFVIQSSEVARQIMIAILTVFTLIFISAGVVLALQNTNDFQITLPVPGETMTFEKALYFIIITTSTVGYGDMSPSTKLARAIIGLYIIIAVIIMTQQTSKLGELMKNSSPYKNPYKTEPGKHIVVTGKFNATTLYRFLKELYHPDHDMPMTECKVLIVNSEPPSKDILAILNHPMYEEAVKYLEADFMGEETLKSAAIDISRGVVVLTNQYEDEIANQDVNAILASSAVKEFSAETPVFLQLVRPDLLMHHYWAGWETGFSTWKFKLSMLSANAFTPGFSTLLSNLMISSSGIMKKECFGNHWVTEYIAGLSNEVYYYKFPKHLIGAKYTDVVKAFYFKNGSLIIGIQTKLNDATEILLNPVDYYIKKSDRAFMIAEGIEDAKEIEELDIHEIGVEPVKFEMFEQLRQMKTPPPIKSVYKPIEERHLLMWGTDLRGSVWDHIIVFGRLEHLEILLETFAKTSNQLVCYVSDQPPDNKWKRISQTYRDALYLECSFSDVEELSHTAISFAYHTILLSNRIEGSTMEDSGLLPLVGLIEKNFTCKFTVELVDEINLKYLDKKPRSELENLPFVVWPRYAASHVFFSSALDYIIAQAFHNNILIDLVQRLIVYEDMFAELGIDENYRINSIELPENLYGKITFGEVFNYLISLQRPLVALGIYRNTGILNNETPYVYTKPDANTPIFLGDKIFVMGELEDRESSPYLKDVKNVKRKTTVIDFSRKKSITKRTSSLTIRKKTVAQSAVQVVEDEVRDETQPFTDEEIINMVRNLLEKTKKERDIINRQNETLINLTSEYNTVQQMLQGMDLEEDENISS
ncbi:unnamed protein product [Blepharisma stoltei]|uniref:Uncharacterized protein n=1 Tax=Blepharisma stoltei TaxID=1481888 RepID=A0AAU9JC92_9CILI|nr:unnamed protein product [Blepharisma stoltei]